MTIEDTLRTLLREELLAVKQDILAEVSRSLPSADPTLEYLTTDREVPVHPLLELVLRAWHDHGFEQAIGHAPKPDDPLAPAPQAGTMRTKNQVGQRSTRDLEIVGIPHRCFHDARRTFISLAQADGAQRAHLVP